MGWAAYFTAALFGDRFIWLGIATVLISQGNFVAHTILFNIKGKTFYNPRMATAILLFLPIAVWYFLTIQTRISDWLIGIPLGIAFNYLGIVKLIDWMADRNTTYIFENRQLRPNDRTR